MSLHVNPTQPFSGIEHNPIKILDRETLEAFLSVLPEMRRLEEVLDHFYYQLHDDKKLPQFSSFFSQILANNPDVFCTLDLNQKAQILFDKYREITLTELYETDNFQTVYRSLLTLGALVTTRASMIKEIIDKNCKSRLHYLHCDVIAFAIAPVIYSQPSTLHFSSHFQSIDLNLEGVRLVFSQTAQNSVPITGSSAHQKV
jgi:hypothetical protein